MAPENVNASAAPALAGPPELAAPLVRKQLVCAKSLCTILSSATRTDDPPEAYETFHAVEALAHVLDKAKQPFVDGRGTGGLLGFESKISKAEGVLAALHSWLRNHALQEVPPREMLSDSLDLTEGLIDDCISALDVLTN